MAGNGLITAHDFTPTVISISGSLAADTYYVCTAAGATTQTLPLATGTNKVIILENTGAGTIALTRAGSDTINGATSIAISPYGRVQVRDCSSGTWMIQGTTANASTTPGLLSYYAEGSFNTYLVDGSLKSAAVLCYYVRVGNLVTLTLKGNTLTTAATTGIKITSTDSASTYTWPAYLKPARDIGCVVRGFDDGAIPTTKSALCIVRASGNGVIDLYADITGAAFTAGNVAKGTSVDFTFSYNLL